MKLGEPELNIVILLKLFIEIVDSINDDDDF